MNIFYKYCFPLVKTSVLNSVEKSNFIDDITSKFKELKLGWLVADYNKDELLDFTNSYRKMLS